MRKTLKGYYTPINPEKYKGDAHRIVYRSSYELKCMELFDTNKNVVSWQSEEKVVLYRSPVDMSLHRYFPDFVITVKNKKDNTLKTFMIEVKPKSQTVPPKKGKNQKRFLQEVMTYGVNSAKWKAAQFYCKKKGWEFKIFTEDHIFGPNYFNS